MAVTYEWTALQMSDSNPGADIVENCACDTLADALATAEQWSHSLIELVRDVGNEADGITYRQWALLTNGKLPNEFDGGAKVPKRFHDECRRASPGYAVEHAREVLY